MLKCVQPSLREDFYRAVDGWFDVYQNGVMSRRNWKEAMVVAVEARVQMAQPIVSIRQQFYQVAQADLDAHQKEISKVQAAVEVQRRRDAQRAGAEAQASSKDKHAEHVGRISEESMCRDHLLDLDWLHLIPKDKDLDWEAECLQIPTKKL